MSPEASRASAAAVARDRAGKPALRASALYRGHAHHERLAPRRHAFRNRLYLLYLDLEELPDLFRGRWFWSARHWAPNRFRRADYLGAGSPDVERPLREVVLERVEAQLGRRPDGAVRILTQLRTFGYLFNPVSFYYCFGVDGELEAVAAEITNTPWGERHTYVLDARHRDGRGRVTARFPKTFHVSPFFDMDQLYQWSFAVPGERLSVGMTNLEEGEPVFHAGLDLVRHELSGPALARALCASPLQTLRVHLAIYVHAGLLWLKRTPFFPHPAKRPTTGSAPLR